MQCSGWTANRKTQFQISNQLCNSLDPLGSVTILLCRIVERWKEVGESGMWKGSEIRKCEDLCLEGTCPALKIFEWEPVQHAVSGGNKDGGWIHPCKRAFSVTVLRLWNSLSLEIRQIFELSAYRRKLPQNFLNEHLIVGVFLLFSLVFFLLLGFFML